MALLPQELQVMLQVIDGETEPIFHIGEYVVACANYVDHIENHSHTLPHRPRIRTKLHYSQMENITHKK